MSIKRNILIIGAGPAGMSAAMELCRAGKDFLVVERSDRVGGLAKTYIIKEGGLEFRTDNGPHRFFSKNKYLYDFIEELLKEKWVPVRRQSRQFIGGKFYDYPINAKQALKNIGPKKSIKILLDYLAAQVKYRILGKKIENFEDYIIVNFGRTLGEFNMINYTEKIWGIPAKKIHPDWARQRIKGLSLFSVLKDITCKTFPKKSSDTPKTLVDAFYFPEYGTGLIYETIKKQIEGNGYHIHTDTYPIKITHDGKKIISCNLTNEGRERVVALDHLIESIPLVEFLNLLSPSPPRKIMDSMKSLRHRDQVYLFITLDKEYVTHDQWIYFPDKNIPFGRVSEMRNFSKKMSPEGKTSLFVEFFCFKGDHIWNLSKEQLFELSLPYFETMGFFNRNEVRNYYLFKQEGVYPIYDLQYKKYLSVVKEYLDGFENLYYIGRPGRFKYNNQDHSLEMGILAARSIIEGSRYNIEDIASGSEYFEKGYVPKNRAV